MSFYEVKKYLAYRLHAKNQHGIHSPFVFNLYNEVIKSRNKYYGYDELDQIRQKIENDKTVIHIEDFGAGSKKMSAERKISDVAGNSVVPKKYGELLFRLVNHFQPATILELGTSLGLSALYMHKASPKSELITIEGCAETYAFAKKIITDNQSQKSIVPRHLRFETFLEKETAGKKFDFVYIDGNHTYAATTKYFAQLLPFVTEKTIIVFDDIYWSEEMTKAWNEIKNHSAVTLTIDLFRFGIVFFRKENKQQEHFCLLY